MLSGTCTTRPSAPRRRRPMTTSGRHPASSPGPWRASGSTAGRALSPMPKSAPANRPRKAPSRGAGSRLLPDAMRSDRFIRLTILPGLGAKRAIDAAHLLGGAVLRQVLPENRPSVGNADANARKPQSAAGQATGAEAQAIPLSRSRFGHTFEKHGQDATEFLTNRARAMGAPNGQFLDNQAAARFIRENLGKTKGGPVSLPMPKDFPARIINPDGSFSPARTIRLIPGGKGVKTAYPEP